jgi:hypothetical protein
MAAGSADHPPNDRMEVLAESDEFLAFVRAADVAEYEGLTLVTG